MILRGHNLLCIQGFVGKGYDAAFTRNMSAIVEALRRDSSLRVTVADAPDRLCSACPNLTGAGCALHGPGTERGIVHQDRDVLARLGLAVGATVPWREVLERILRSVAPDDLDAICGACPWLPLGHCKEGLQRLRATPPPG
ncbi:MAG: DUF1284 domain-containing protein [Planctomycetaceae bacterium]